MSTQQMTDSHDIMDGVNPQYIDTHMKSIDHKRNYKNGINKYHFPHNQGWRPKNG